MGNGGHGYGLEAATFVGWMGPQVWGFQWGQGMWGVDLAKKWREVQQRL